MLVMDNLTFGFAFFSLDWVKVQIKENKWFLIPLYSGCERMRSTLQC